MQAQEMAQNDEKGSKPLKYNKDGQLRKKKSIVRKKDITVENMDGDDQDEVHEDPDMNDSEGSN